MYHSPNEKASKKVIFTAQNLKSSLSVISGFDVPLWAKVGVVVSIVDFYTRS